MFLSYKNILNQLLSASLFVVLFFSISFAQAQESSLLKSNRDTVDFLEERQLIPGETMGQKMESLLFWSEVQKKKRFPHMQDIFPSIAVAQGPNVYSLTEGTSIERRLPKNFVRNYIDENQIGGIIVLKDDKIRLEHYGKEVDHNTVWTSFSVGKSVTSMLLGIALKEGDIKSLSDPLSKYIPELRGYDYGKVTVKQLLTMTSGIDWNEDYADTKADVAQMYRQPCFDSEPHILSYMKSLKFIHTPGDIWNYSTGETDLLGILIQKATGKNLADYLSEKIWKPWGMEHRAYWLADECSMLNLGGSGLSATLRDYARLGTVMLKDGKKQNDNSLFAEEWLKNATSLLMPTGDDGGGYGYLWWRFPNGSYAAFGIFGQMIYINPNTKVIIAQFASWPHAGSKALSSKRMEFIETIENVLSKD